MWNEKSILAVLRVLQEMEVCSSLFREQAMLDRLNGGVPQEKLVDEYVIWSLTVGDQKKKRGRDALFFIDDRKCRNKFKKAKANSTS